MFDQVLVGLGILWGLICLLIYLQGGFREHREDTECCEHLLKFLLENRVRFPNLLNSNMNPVMEQFRKEYKGIAADKIRPSEIHTFAAQIEVKLEQVRSVKQNPTSQKQISEQEL